MVRPSWVSVTAVAGLCLAGVLAWWWPRAADGADTRDSAPPAGARPSGAGGPPAAAGGPPGGGGAGRGTPAVEVATVQAVRLVDEVPAVGTLRSRQSVTVRPEVGGRIVSIGFRDGAAVRRGQVLFQFDDALQRAELAQARAQLSVAQANLKRNEELVAQAFVAQRVLDESRAALQVAQAQVDLAQARAARMRITAPFDGTAGIRDVHVGDYVREGTDLVHLEDTAQLLVDFRLPERHLSQVRVGQSVRLSLDALPGQSFEARVQAIDPLVDASGRALLLRAALNPGRETPLRPGMFARVALVLGVTDVALMVPEEAIVPQGTQTLVYRIEREGAEGAPVAKRVPVKLGVRRDGRVQVLDGLQAGDTIVIAGQQRLQRDAMPVRIVDPQRRG